MTIQVQLNARIDVEVVQELQRLAGEVGCPINALAELFLKRGIATAQPEALGKWAEGLRAAPKRRPVYAMKKNERRVLQTFDQLKALKWSGTVFSHVVLARTSGLLLREAYDALAALQGRGMVAGVCTPNRDPWNRPLESFWWLPADALPGVDQSLVMEAVYRIRVEMLNFHVDEYAWGLVVKFARDSSGWSDATLAFPQKSRVSSTAPREQRIEIGDAMEWLQKRWPVKIA